MSHVLLNVRSAVALCAAMFIALWANSGAFASDALHPLTITQVEADKTAGVLYIHGRNFGAALPEVRLADGVLSVQQNSDNLLVVLLPASYFDPPGEYLLSVSVGPNVSQNDVFDVTLGAVGPQGPVGPPGLKGDPGYTGALMCRYPVGAQSDSYAVPGSYVGCDAGESLTGGLCLSAPGSVASTAQLQILNGTLVYTCLVRGPQVPGGWVVAQAFCCKIH